MKVDAVIAQGHWSDNDGCRPPEVQSCRRAVIVLRVNVLGLIRGYLMEIITSFREFFGVDD